MKIIATALLFLAAPSAASTKVKLMLQCKGVDISKTSLVDKTLMAHALEDSYNDAHSASEAKDDSTLEHVHWGAAGFDEQHLGPYPGWGGDWDCHWCENDDAFMVGSAGVMESSATHKVWETKFVEAITSKGKKSLEGCTACIITMTPAGLGAAVDEVEEPDDESAGTTKVDIAVAATGLQLNKLSVTDVTVVSHCLEESYAKAHADFDKDDSQLTNVHFGHSQRFDEKHLGPYPGWGGDWDCHWCENDDAVFTDVTQLESGPAHKAWETEFCSCLVKSGRASFKNVSKCVNTMTAISQSLGENESIKRGLRG